MKFAPGRVQAGRAPLADPARALRVQGAQAEMPVVPDPRPVRLSAQDCGISIRQRAARLARCRLPFPRSRQRRAWPQRFRGFLPVVVDVETGGFDCEHDALLEIAVVVVRMDADGWVHPEPAVSHARTGVPRRQHRPQGAGDHRHRSGSSVPHGALPEREALEHVFKPVRAAIRDGRLPARDPGRPQRRLRSVLPQRGGAPQRPQAQPVPSVLVLRHRHARRACLRPDRAVAVRCKPPVSIGTPARRTPRCTTPNAPPCCSARSSIAGSGWRTTR